MAGSGRIERFDGGRRIVVTSPRRGGYEAMLVGVLAGVALAVYLTRVVASPDPATVARFRDFATALAAALAILGAALAWRWHRGPRVDELVVRAGQLTHTARRGQKVLGSRTARLEDVGNVHVTHEGAPPSITSSGGGRRMVVAFQMAEATRFVGEYLPQQTAEELRTALDEALVAARREG